jgi:hypothetical protein
MQANPTGHTPQTRAKAVYCMSGLLRHNRAAVEQLDALGGWQVFKGGLTGMWRDLGVIQWDLTQF